MDKYTQICQNLGTTHQQQIATLLGVTRVTVNRWANGKGEPNLTCIKLSTLIRLWRKYHPEGKP